MKRLKRGACLVALAFAVVPLLLAGSVVPSFPAPSLELAPTTSFSGTSRIVAVGDVHGDVSALESVLKFAGLLGPDGHWSGGDAHLVQTGDVMDRGNASRASLDLLMRLEEEARGAGGQVHALIGNHEAMNMLGDLRYLTHEDLATFADLSSTPDPPLKPKGYLGHQRGFGMDGTYNRWLRSRPAAVLIDGVLFVHGGISPEVNAGSLEALNRWVRQDFFPNHPAGGARSRNGPLWFRGYAYEPEIRIEKGLDQVLARYSARMMVMGHTTTGGPIIQRFHGKAIFIDTGLCLHYGRNLAALEIRGDQLTALYPDRREPLVPPQGSTLPIM